MSASQRDSQQARSTVHFQRWKHHEVQHCYCLLVMPNLPPPQALKTAVAATVLLHLWSYSSFLGRGNWTWMSYSRLVKLQITPHTGSFLTHRVRNPSEWINHFQVHWDGEEDCVSQSSGYSWMAETEGARMTLSLNEKLLQQWRAPLASPRPRANRVALGKRPQGEQTPPESPHLQQSWESKAASSRRMLWSLRSAPAECGCQEDFRPHQSTLCIIYWPLGNTWAEPGTSPVGNRKHISVCILHRGLHS